MRLAKLRNFKFSDLNFYHYFFTAYIGLHVAFALLLGTMSAFAPDEYTYKGIFLNLYSRDFTSSSVLGFMGTWEPWLRALYLPAKLLTYIGITDLYAIRFLSISFSTLATYLLVRLARENACDSRNFRVALICISFIPTVFLWSSIGLRESFLYAEISGILYFLARIHKKLDLRNFGGLGLSVFSLSMTKNYIFILFLFAFLTALIFFSISRKKEFLTHLAVGAIFLFPLACNPTLIPAISEYFSGQLAAPDSQIVGDLNNDGICNGFELCDSNPSQNSSDYENGNQSEAKVSYVTTGGMTVHALFNELTKDPNTVIARIFRVMGLTDKIEEVVKENIVLETETKVKENKEDLALQQATLKKPDQIVVASLKFLLLPFIFIDNGSLFLNIQSIETPIWLSAYIIFFISLFRVFLRKREVDFCVFIAAVFAIEFVGLSALIEENVGTALRHRSLLLIPILVIWVARKKKPASL